MRWFLALVFLAAIPAGAQIIGPKGDRYELRVDQPKAAVYAAVLTVLSDSSYQIKEASLEGGLVRTDWSKPGDTDSKGVGGALKSHFRDPIRLMLVLIPIGSDSTRVTITGDSRLEKLDRTMKISTGDRGNWRLLKSAGDAILEALR